MVVLFIKGRFLHKAWCTIFSTRASKSSFLLASPSLPLSLQYFWQPCLGSGNDYHARQTNQIRLLQRPQKAIGEGREVAFLPL